MKNATYFAASFCFSIMSIPAFANDAPDWNQIAAGYMAFTSNAMPNDAAGQKLLGILPSDASCDGNDTAIPDLMIDGRYFEQLTKQAYRGNKYAAEAMFRLSKLVCGDGEHSETMDINLGRMIKAQPKLFLDLLEKYRIDDLSGLLGNLGEAFVDKPLEQEKELQLRYTALAAVKDAPHETQSRCLEELRKEIDQDKQAILGGAKN